MTPVIGCKRLAGHLSWQLVSRCAVLRGAKTSISTKYAHKILALKKGFKSRDLFEAACKLKGLHPVIALESSAPHTLIALSEAGLGFAIVPALTRVPNSSIRVFALTMDDKPIEFDFCRNLGSESSHAAFCAPFHTLFAGVH
jgi:DNA-binding transcriptional LysR family regulator